MTIRDLIISFGYEIDQKAEKKVNESIDGLKTFASDALGSTEVGFEVDSASERMVKESIEGLEDAAAPLAENTVGFEVDSASEQEAMNSIQRLRSMAIRALGVIGIGFSLVQMTRLSEEFGGINDKIRDATRGLGDQQEIQQRILRAANEARQDYGVMATTISRLAQNTAVFADVEAASSFATLMAQDFAGAAIAQEKSAYLTRYLAMDLQKGAVSSRAMNTMLRDAPHMAIRLANSIGVSTYELQEMARRGEISAEVLKDSFVGSADEIAARFAETDMNISDALRNVRNGWGLFVSEMDNTLGVSRAVARGIVTGFNQVLFTLRRLMDAFMRIADRLGGVRNLMRLLAIAAGAILIALKGPAILQLLRNISRGIMGINKKMLAIVAIAIILALIIDDFLAFMRGEDSLLGHLLEKFGIDAEEVREIVLELWEVIRGIIPFIMELARAFGGLLLDALRMILPLLMDLLRQIMPPLIDFIGRLISLLVDVAAQVLPLLLGIVEKLIPFILDIIQAILPVLINLIETLLPIVMSIIETVLPILMTLLERLIPIFMEIIRNILPVFTALLDILIPIIEMLAELIGDLLTTAFEVLIPIIEIVIDTILPILMMLLDALMPIIQMVAELVGRVLRLAFETIVPVIMQIIRSILPVLMSLLDALMPIVTMVATIIGDVLGAAFQFIIPLISRIIETILPILMGLLEALMPVISFVAELIGNVLAAAFESIMPIINAVMDIFSGLIDFIVGVFTGDWTRAWEGIRNIFSGIISGLAAIFKMPINLIITGLNTFIGGLNRISIPSWVPGVGGKGINIPKIPMLATGSDFSPDTFIAGEEGPELITNAKGSKVFTAAETADTLGKLNALANWKPPAFVEEAKKKGPSGGIARIIKDMAALVTMPAEEAAEVYHSHVENKTVTQYNEFYNEFHGDRAGQQKSSEAMDEAQEDATGALARALAYVR